jgi:PAS domain S-box-containing protein
MKNNHNHSKRLSGYVFILIFFLFSVGIFITGYSSYQNYAHHFRDEVANELSAITKLKIDELVQWRKERLGDSSMIFKNIAFSNLVRDFIRNPKDMTTQRQLQIWMDKYQGYYEYNMVCLLDIQGETRMSVPTETIPLCSFVYQYIPETLNSGKVSFTDFYRDEQNQHVYLSILVPILDEQYYNRPLGVVVLRIDPERYLYPLIRIWPTPSRTAETLLVRRDGNNALFLNDLKFQKNTALKLRISLKNTNIPAVKAALGMERVEEGTDYRGVPVIASTKKVPDSPWFMVARMDISEVYAPMREHLWQLILFAGILLLCAASGLGFVWRQQNIRFYQDRYEAAQALIVSEARYRRLFEAARDGILILDADTGIIVDVNPFLMEILAFSYEQIVGKKLWELGFFKDIVANQTNFLELMEKEYIRYEDLPLETADGRRIEVEFVSNIYLVGNEKVIQCNIRDITLRKQAEQKLLETNKELEQFAYVASHDLQEPLRTVSSFTGLLEKRYNDKLDERGKEYITFIIEGAFRMERIINDLLTLSRIGRINMERSNIDCNDIIDKVVIMMHDSIKKTDANITYNSLPTLNANETNLVQLFQNLIGNALKFHKEGDSPRINIAVQRNNNEWLFSVKDNGIGIDPKYFGKIFVIFQRLHNRQEYSGTGIGLSICKKIVESYGGRIWVESTVGEGTTFYFTFPVNGKEKELN